MIEDWRKYWSDHKIVAALFIDLSKAFDWLPDRIVWTNPSAYSLSNDICNLLMSHLSERKRRTNIGNFRSSWSEIIKCFPQWSILGPLLFSVFINDIFYAVENVYNYEDDNVLCHSGDPSLQEVVASYESSTRTALKWFFGNNLMLASPDKFQTIVFGLKTKYDDICFNINWIKVEATKCMKQLGAYIDDNLSFSEHISHLCIKAARQLNSLQKIIKCLSENAKMIVFSSFIFYQISIIALKYGIYVAFKMQ